MSLLKFKLQKSRMEYIVGIADELEKGWKSTRLQEVLLKLELVQAHSGEFEKTHEMLAEAKTDALLAYDYYKKTWYETCLNAYSVSLAELCTMKDDIKKK